LIVASNFTAVHPVFKISRIVAPVVTIVVLVRASLWVASPANIALVISGRSLVGIGKRALFVNVAFTLVRRVVINHASRGER